MARIKKTTKSSAPINQERVKEILACKNPLHFIKTYCKVSHPTKGLVDFRTYPYQDDCVKAFVKNRFVIVNKSRQLGLSTVSAAYSLWLALFHKEKNVLVIATDLGVATNFMKKVFTYLENLPAWIVLPKVIKNTQKEIRFSNGSQIKAIPTTPSAGRSEAVSLLILDETAHIDNVDDIWLGLSPTLSTGGSAIMISTPNGRGNLFHKIWVGAQDKSNDFYPIELPWKVHPEHDQAWFEKESNAVRAAKGERGIGQEFLCDFLASGDTFIKNEYMELLEKQVSEPIAKHQVYDDLWIWKHVEPGHKYLVSMDVARGDAFDHSAAMVFDLDADELVAEYKGKVPPDKFAEIAIEIGKQYNGALLCPENNGPGLVTAMELKKLGYQNLFYEKHHRNAFQAYSSPAPLDNDDLCGITTQAKNREEMLVKLENILRNGFVRIPSARFIDELKTFVYKGNKPQAMKGYNDDLVMCCAIGMYLFESSNKSIYNPEDFRLALLAGSSLIQLNPWGLTNTENDGKNNSFISPIISSNKIGNNTNANPGNPYQKGTRQGNPRDPFWQQWDWVLRK